MSSDYSPVVANPRPVPWPFRVLEAALVAGAVGVVLDVVTLAPAAQAILFGALLLGAVVTDAWMRSRYAGTGLERSFLQLVVAGFTLLVIVIAVLVVGQQPPLAVALPTVLGVGVLVYAVLHWDQRRQVRRARSVAEKRARSGL